MSKKLLLLFFCMILSTSLYAESQFKNATFAGGCFWCIESAFQETDLSGIEDVVSGYAGGTDENPTYDDYAEKGHIEVIQISYDPAKVSYEQLLDLFWRQINPTDPDGQFVDRGPQYRSAVFYHDEEQKRLAEASKMKLNKSGFYSKPIVTEIIRFQKFYKAEDYHQDYYKRQPLKYKYYRFTSGRDGYLDKIWGAGMTLEDIETSDSKYKKPSDEVLKKKLTPLQYKVTQEEGTERPFDNLYNDNYREGIYVDIVSGEPLFSSKDKFKSGTGWPSFTKPLVAENIVEKEDRNLFSIRTEIRSKHADSHLGHVFNDGPEPTGLRYCINSAALQFIPKEELVHEGYGDYAAAFDQ